MPARLTQVDELIRDTGLHAHIDADDNCYFLREYTRGGGYQASSTNQLIFNLKKGTDQHNRPGYHYKAQAIETCGRELREAMNEEFLKQATLVPIPPSAARSDPRYDDRMTQVIHRMCQGLRSDIRELLCHRESIASSHLSDARPSLNEIYENYYINEDLAEPEPTVIGLFDDILTAGTHFKAAKQRLQQRFRNIDVIGIFIARRILPPAE